MRRRLLATLLLLTTPSLRAASPELLSLFHQGQVEGSLGAGFGSFNNNDYLLLGLGGGYYFLDNLEAGLSGEAWLGSRPQIYDISPQLRYVIPLDTTWTPYIGALYRRTAYSQEFPPIDSAGVRAGLIFPLGPKSYLSAGVAFEHYFDCDSSIYSHCNQAYPEVGAAISL